MKVEWKDLSPVKKSLAIEADPDDIARETDDAVRRTARQAKIPGFRPGKVPLEIVRARFGKEIQDDVRERLMARLYTEATRERGVEPLADPVVDEVHFDDGALRFRTTFEVRPEFELKDYRGIQVREPSAGVSDTEVDEAIEEIRRAQAKLVTEDGRAAATGDLVVADVEGTPDAGEAFRRERIVIEVGATGNLPAFNDGLVGATAGSRREFPVAYPAEYEARHLAGQTVRYVVTVHEVKRSELPALDDEFAKDLGEFDSLATLRARVREDLGERKRAEARQAVRNAVLDKLLLENPVPLPETLVEAEIRHRLEDLVRTMVMQGIDPQKLEVNWKEVRDRQVEPARRAVHARLLLDRVARAETLAADPADVDARIRHDAERTRQDWREVRRRLQQGGGMEALQTQLVREKSLDFITSVANIQREG